MLTVDGVDCVMAEPHIDYYRDLCAYLHQSLVVFFRRY
jgi:hypothetical protein